MRASVRDTPLFSRIFGLGSWEKRGSAGSPRGAGMFLNDCKGDGFRETVVTAIEMEQPKPDSVALPAEDKQNRLSHSSTVLEYMHSPEGNRECTIQVCLRKLIQEDRWEREQPRRY